MSSSNEIRESEDSNTDLQPDALSKYFTKQCIMGAAAPEAATNEAAKGTQQNMEFRMRAAAGEEPKIDSDSFMKSVAAVLPWQAGKFQQIEEMPSTSTQIQKKNLNLLVSNVARALYSPPLKGGDESYSPPPQFETVPCFSSKLKMLMHDKEGFTDKGPISAVMLNLTRTPIQCPVASCQTPTFVSGICDHIVVDHTKLPVKQISAGQCVNLQLDLKSTLSTNCHAVYFVRDKVINMGSGKYKDFLPVLLMGSRINLRELYDATDAELNYEILVLWLAGLVPVDFPLEVKLAVWSPHGKTYRKVCAGEVHSLRLSQKPIDVVHSGNCMLLYPYDIDLLTENHQNTLQIQVMLK